MEKVWLIAWHQFRKETSKRSFLLVLFSMPLFLGMMVGFGLLGAALDRDDTPVGYVDEAGLLNRDLPESENSDVLVRYDSRSGAQAALEAKQIGSYYVLTANYPATRKTLLFYREQPGREAAGRFHDMVRFNLMTDQSPAVVTRTLSKGNVTVRATDSKRDFPDAGPTAAHVLPLVAGFIFAFLIMTTSGYMTEVVHEEKANRTMEILLSSVSTGRMMAGKILGAVGIAFLQLVVWLVTLALGLWLGANVLDVAWLQGITPIWRDIFLVALVAIPTYVLVAAGMALLGSLMSSDSDAQQAAALSMVMLAAPIYLLIPIAQNPDGAVALIFSLFPGTSVLTIALRTLFIEVPAWQYGVAAGVSLIGALFTIWLAGKVFRMSVLRYGQSLKLGELLRRGDATIEPAAKI